jgi:uncharacterized protein YqhQ
MKESGGYKKRRKMGDDEEEVEERVNSRKAMKVWELSLVLIHVYSLLFGSMPFTLSGAFTVMPQLF